MPATELMDLLQFGDLLIDEQRLIQKTVRSFVQDKVEPHIADWFERACLRASSPSICSALACLACT
jgi:glutaryl-CoA dehydrogenase